MIHITEQELQSYIDASIAEEEKQSVGLHLESCISCSRSLRKLRYMERMIRQSFEEKAPDRVIENVLNRLGIEEAPSFIWNIVNYVAPVVALLIIGTIVLLVFVVFGKVHEAGLQSSLQTGQSIYSIIRSSLQSSIGAFSESMKKLAPFAFEGKNIGITLFVCLFILALGLFDKFLLAPMMKRGRHVV